MAKSTAIESKYVEVRGVKVHRVVFEQVCDAFAGHDVTTLFSRRIWAYIARFNTRLQMPGKEMSLSIYTGGMDFFHYDTPIVCLRVGKDGRIFAHMCHGGFGPAGLASKTTASRINDITGYKVFDRVKVTDVMTHETVIATSSGAVISFEKGAIVCLPMLND